LAGSPIAVALQRLPPLSLSEAVVSSGSALGVDAGGWECFGEVVAADTEVPLLVVRYPGIGFDEAVVSGAEEGAVVECWWFRRPTRG